MLRLPEIGSHAAYEQLLSQRIHNHRLEHFDKKKLKLAKMLLCLDLSPVDEIMRPFLLGGRTPSMAAFLDATFLLAFYLAQVYLSC